MKEEEFRQCGKCEYYQCPAYAKPMTGSGVCSYLVEIGETNMGIFVCSIDICHFDLSKPPTHSLSSLFSSSPTQEDLKPTPQEIDWARRELSWLEKTVPPKQRDSSLTSP
jgi:hypothetical protein